jgi:hypothetical protein
MIARGHFGGEQTNVNKRWSLADGATASPHNKTEQTVTAIRSVLLSDITDGKVHKRTSSHHGHIERQSRYRFEKMHSKSPTTAAAAIVEGDDKHWKVLETGTTDSINDFRLPVRLAALPVTAKRTGGASFNPRRP